MGRGRRDVVEKLVPHPCRSTVMGRKKTERTRRRRWERRERWLTASATEAGERAGVLEGIDRRFRVGNRNRQPSAVGFGRDEGVERSPVSDPVEGIGVDQEIGAGFDPWGIDGSSVRLASDAWYGLRPRHGLGQAGGGIVLNRWGYGQIGGNAQADHQQKYKAWGRPAVHGTARRSEGCGLNGRPMSSTSLADYIGGETLLEVGSQMNVGFSDPGHSVRVSAGRPRTSDRFGFSVASIGHGSQRFAKEAENGPSRRHAEQIGSQADQGEGSGQAPLEEPDRHRLSVLKHEQENRGEEQNQENPL